ncbi:MAG: helix-turn-helix domain-containing protein [Phycisphaerales bacterium]|nr:helix-turn-helix domain-containing protein [Phycisphaerales bacterium]
MRGKTKKDVLTTGEIARLCNVAPRTVAKWFDTGELRGYRIPGSRDRRVPLQQLIRFMRQHQMPLEGLDTGAIRVLLVDVGQSYARALEQQLAADPRFEVHLAGSLFEAGLQAALVRPQVLVMNLALPGADPDALIAALRAWEHGGEVRAIALAAGVSDEQVESLLRAGFHSVLRAPIEAAKLRQLCDLGATGATDR